MNPIQRLAHWFIQPELHPDEEELRKISLVVYFSLAISGGGILVILTNFYWMTLGMIMGVFVVVIALGLLPLLVRMTGSHILAANLIVGFLVMNTMRAGAFDFGGQMFPAMIWGVVIPLIAIFMLGIVNGAFWAALDIALCFVVYALKQNGSLGSLPAITPLVEPVIFSFLVLLIFTITSLYESLKTKLYQQLRKRAKDLEALNQTILEQQQQLVTTSKMAALGEMAGGVAHEINNPLAIIRMASDQIQDMLEVSESSATLEDRPLIRERLHVVIATTERISKIIKGLRSFSREAQTDPFQTVSVKNIVNDTLTLCSEKFKTKTISVNTEKVANHITIYCQPVPVSQAILNLLYNAFDAIKDLPQRWIEIAAHEKNGIIILTVTDSGAGIPVAIAKKMFQPFFTTKEIGQGTGLGLSIAKGIIENQKGKLYWDSESPQTRFVIEFSKQN